MNRHKYLFAASTGGHLAQLVRLSTQFNPSEDSMWITFDTPQSRSLLQGKRVTYVPYIASRDYIAVVRTIPQIVSLLRVERFDKAISTGAALALSVLPAATLAGVDTTYIESVSRIDGPSVTGRLLRWLPVRHLRTQHPEWSKGRWRPIAPVLTRFISAPSTPPPSDRRLRVFVTLGTIRPYRFDSLIQTLLTITDDNLEFVWQFGETAVPHLPGRSYAQVSAEQFQEFSEWADVVITHAGVGTILGLLEAGIFPVVVPRRKERKEHVDNHQAQIAGLMDRLGLAVVRESDALTAQDLRHAASMKVAAR